MIGTFNRQGEASLDIAIREGFFAKRGDFLGGTRIVVHCPNGYGASIIKSQYSYGHEEGLWELAVLTRSGEITYDTPITGDVVGHCDENMLRELLTAISKLPRCP